jgi:hypothetical protein
MNKQKQMSGWGYKEKGTDTPVGGRGTRHITMNPYETFQFLH